MKSFSQLFHFTANPNRDMMNDSSDMGKQSPPEEFVCPINGSLMSDPVIVSSGETFERTSVQVCRELRYYPLLPDGTKPDFTTVIPNKAIKSLIVKWCKETSTEFPSVPSYYSVKGLVKKMVGDNQETEEREIESQRQTQAQLKNVGSPSTATAEEAELLKKMTSSDVEEQVEGVVSLREMTRRDKEARVLCTNGILDALGILLASRQLTVQINAVASLLNMSLQEENKKKIVKSGTVPFLIEVLKSESIDAQEYAAGALLELSLDDDNKTAIGVLGGLQPLIHALKSENDRTRRDSALALYRLTRVQTNRVKLVNLGAVPTLLDFLKKKNMAGRVILVICNLAMCNEGKGAMLDGNAVGLLVEMLKKGDFDSPATRENVVGALYWLSQASKRFKGLAREAGAVEVMKKEIKESTELAADKARRMLQLMRD